ncbi:hypothetical protein LCGC14_3156460, partial [marine sediment metagenome]
TGPAFDPQRKGGATVSRQPFRANARVLARVASILALIVAAASTRAADPLPFVDGSWTIVLLPDTQKYSSASNPAVSAIFSQMTTWAVANKASRNIQFLTGLGDITDYDSTAEWNVAKGAMSALDGHLPYALVTGNHDYSGGTAADRTTRLNDYFSASDNPLNDPDQLGTLAAFYQPGRLESTVHRFIAPDGRKMAIFALEWGPRDGVVAWADGLAAGLADHTALLVTHAYLYSDDTRYDWSTYGASQSWNPHAYGTASDPDGTNDGEELWTKLVRKHGNFEMTFNGHVLNDGLGYLASTADEGNTVHQMLFNTQMEANGGNGWLRLLEFLPDGRT